MLGLDKGQIYRTRSLIGVRLDAHPTLTRALARMKREGPRDIETDNPGYHRAVRNGFLGSWGQWQKKGHKAGSYHKRYGITVKEVRRSYRRIFACQSCKGKGRAPFGGPLGTLPCIPCGGEGKIPSIGFRQWVRETYSFMNPSKLSPKLRAILGNV